jgi:hypothetical protein
MQAIVILCLLAILAIKRGWGIVIAGFVLGPSWEAPSASSWGWSSVPVARRKRCGTSGKQSRHWSAEPSGRSSAPP